MNQEIRRMSTTLEKPSVDRIDQIDAKLDRVLDLLRDRSEVRQHFSVEECAPKLNKSAYTIREWCRMGRINAFKCNDKRGDSAAWRVSAEEISRILDFGLLPIDPSRNTK
jgi:hypothetical protein